MEGRVLVLTAGLRESTLILDVLHLRPCALRFAAQFIIPGARDEVGRSPTQVQIHTFL